MITLVVLTVMLDVVLTVEVVTDGIIEDVNTVTVLVTVAALAVIVIVTVPLVVTVARTVVISVKGTVVGSGCEQITLREDVQARNCGVLVTNAMQAPLTQLVLKGMAMTE